MNNALAVVSDNEWQGMLHMAETLVASGFLPQSVNTPQKAVAIILAGRELNIGPWQALMTINVIQGKPTISPQLMLALIENSGQLEDKEIQGDGTQCAVMLKRRGRTPHTEIFTIKDAQAMGLASKDNWKKQPATMLKWRAVAACARVVFPDIILGLYTPDEMGAEVSVSDDGEMTIVSAPPEPAIDMERAPRLGNGEPRRLGSGPAAVQDGNKPRWTVETLKPAVLDLFQNEHNYYAAIKNYRDPAHAEFLLRDEMTPAEAEARVRFYRSRTGKAEMRIFEDQKTRDALTAACVGLVADDRAIVEALDAIADYPIGGLSAWKGDKATAWAAVLAAAGNYDPDKAPLPENSAAVTRELVWLISAHAGAAEAEDAHIAFEAI